MPIDNLTIDIEQLQKYEGPKVAILKRMLAIIRGYQTEGNYEKVKEEMGHLKQAAERIDAVIPGQINRFSNNKKIIEKLVRQKQIVEAIANMANSYKENPAPNNPMILNRTYNSIFDAIQNFITISNNMIKESSLKVA